MSPSPNSTSSANTPGEKGSVTSEAYIDLLPEAAYRAGNVGEGPIGFEGEEKLVVEADGKGPVRVAPGYQEDGSEGRGKPTKLQAYSYDVEEGKLSLQQQREKYESGLKQGLSQRHLQMIALAGAIGTGLFLGSSYSLSNAGPVGLLLGYLIVSTVVISVVLSMGELTALAPTSGSYVRHASMWVDPALGFTVGWNLTLGSAIGVPATITSCVVLAQYWNESVNAAMVVTVFGVAIFLTNAISIKWYGEVEFTFAMVKIVTIVGLIIFGICIDLGAGPQGRVIGFSYWKNPGPFAEYLVEGASGRFVGFWYVLVNAAYSFVGVESAALAAAETKSPRQNIPMAAKRVFFRIAVLYMVSLFVISLIVPYNDERLVNYTGTASQSPFVVAAERAGVKSIASIVNAMVLLSAWSSANTGILNASRSLFGMALDGHAPKIFLRTHRAGIPWVGVTFVTLFMGLAYTCLSTSATKVFGYFIAVTASSALWEWITISITSIRFHKALRVQGIDRKELPFSPWFQPYLAWWGLIGSSTILLTGGFYLFVGGPSLPNFNAPSFLSAYASPILNVILLVGYKLIRRTKLVSPEELPVQVWLEDIRDNPEEPLEKRKGWKRFITFLWA
ncbi:hypothetical protein IE53DRAFT_388676 [Violaceomyces palustris]|uniref:Uncharacterized protein n=1 Tax=Violaceomyces palustris TaxID=1673888 RepID=A0ACD0NTH5_9BASI|nr:hypothetical protein IE53DRAFT_388676 [Violaceomyces palustris]